MKSKSFKIGRKMNGRLCKVEYARKHPDKTFVEHMPKKGYGTAK